MSVRAAASVLNVSLLIAGESCSKASRKSTCPVACNVAPEMTSIGLALSLALRPVSRVPVTMTSPMLLEADVSISGLAVSALIAGLANDTGKMKPMRSATLPNLNMLRPRLIERDRAPRNSLKSKTLDYPRLPSIGLSKGQKLLLIAEPPLVDIEIFDAAFE